jgi:hypothetical protein
LDEFEGQVASDEYFNALLIAKLEYSTLITTVNSDHATLISLMGTYSNVVSLCFTNNGGNKVLKSNLSAADLAYFTNFVTDTGPYGLKNFPDTVLKDMDTLTGTGSGQNNLYGAALTELQLQVPFEHQTYGSMYKLFNYVTAERAMALYLKKEYQSYLWSQQTSTSLSQWMTQYFLEDFGGSVLNTEVNNINADVANNPIIYKMATLLANSAATNGTQRLAYLGGLITTNYPFPSGTQLAYQVICNFNHCTYLIPQNAGTFPYHIVGNVAVPYPALNYTLNTADGRFQMEPDVTGSMPGTLIGLLTWGMAGSVQPNPLTYLTGTSVSGGGLTNLPSGVDGIVLANTQYIDNGNDQALYVLDAQGYAGGSNPNGQYVEDSGGNIITLSEMANGTTHHFANGDNIPLKQATYLTVYYDTDISTLLSTNASGAYYPTTSGALGPLVSLSTGEVLDLSHLHNALNCTIRICGNATIIGGGPSMTISNLMIDTYGGSLTVSNLFISSVTNIINNANGPLTLVAQGTNCFQSTLVQTYDSYGYGDYGYYNQMGAVIGAQGDGNITFTGPGALAVTTSSTNMPAVLTAGTIIANGAASLTFSSQSSSSVFSGSVGSASRNLIFIINSKVTSYVGSESDGEFAASRVTLGNSVLDMSYGIINPNIINPCTWLGKIRGQSQFTVQQAPAGIGPMHDGIFVKLVGTTGTSEFMNINSAGAYNVQWGGTPTFNMS